jgi:hypothetical protein
MGTSLSTAPQAKDGVAGSGLINYLNNQSLVREPQVNQRCHASKPAAFAPEPALLNSSLENFKRIHKTAA